MATQSFDNVISLDASQASPGGRRRVVKPESVAVINDCRDIAVKRITEILAKTFNTIEDELFELAEKSFDREKQNFYLDARTQAREKRGAIETAFRKQFLSFFEKKVSGEDEAARKPSSDFRALSLVEDNELEEKLAMNDIATRLSGKCDEELSALSQRMGFLMSVPEMKEQANPMSPDTVVKALRAACDQMTSGYETKLAVMKMVEQHMANEMLAVYHDINAHLIGRQILPQIRPVFRKAQTNIARKSGVAMTPQPESGNAPGCAAPPAADIFATLQQLLAGGKLFDTGMSADSAAPPANGVTTSSFAPAPRHADAEAARAAREMANILGGGENLPNPRLVSTLSQLQLQVFGRAANNVAGEELPFAPSNAVREIKSSGVANGSSQVDAMTIDIVAMLFDYVFADKGIPDSIKALLARLQIPVLKVAILDKSFFSRKNHPTRRLLDALADASVCFADNATHSDPLYKKIQEIVECIQTEFDTDIQLFSQVLAGFEQFLSARATADAQVVEQSARVLHERERHELARMVANDETGRRASVTDVPPPVHAMLIGPWTRVLERVYLREGGRNSRFVAALETADNLIWSVAPKTDAEQRKRLVRLLPALLQQLQEGLQIAAVEATDCERFFSSLVDCHAAAVRAGLRGESASALLSAAQASAEIAPLFAKLIAEETAQKLAMEKAAAARSGLARIQFTDKGVEIEEVAAAKVGSEPMPKMSAGGDGSSSGNNMAIAHDSPGLALKRGTWVEFVRSSGKKIRVKLSWISPLQGIYLFTNPSASGALSVTPEALESQFRRGDARIIEESSLVDRAVDNMVHSLSGAMLGQ